MALQFTGHLCCDFIWNAPELKTFRMQILIYLCNNHLRMVEWMQLFLLTLHVGANWSLTTEKFISINYILILLKWIKGSSNARSLSVPIDQYSRNRKEFKLEWWVEGLCGCRLTLIAIVIARWLLHPSNGAYQTHSNSNAPVDFYAAVLDNVEQYGTSNINLH